MEISTSDLIRHHFAAHKASLLPGSPFGRRSPVRLWKPAHPSGESIGGHSFLSTWHFAGVTWTMDYSRGRASPAPSGESGLENVSLATTIENHTLGGLSVSCSQKERLHRYTSVIHN